MAGDSPTRWIVENHQRALGPKANRLVERGCDDFFDAEAVQPRSGLSARAGAYGSRFHRCTSNDLEVALQFPVGDCVLPLTPLPLAGRRKMIDEQVAEPVARA